MTDNYSSLADDLKVVAGLCEAYEDEDHPDRLIGLLMMHDRAKLQDTVLANLYVIKNITREHWSEFPSFLRELAEEMEKNAP